MSCCTAWSPSRAERRMARLGARLSWTPQRHEFAVHRHYCTIGMSNPALDDALFKRYRTSAWLLLTVIHACYAIVFTTPFCYTSLLMTMFINPHVGYIDDVEGHVSSRHLVQRKDVRRRTMCCVRQTVRIQQPYRYSVSYRLYSYAVLYWHGTEHGATQIGSGTDTK